MKDKVDCLRELSLGRVLVWRTWLVQSEPCSPLVEVSPSSRGIANPELHESIPNKATLLRAGGFVFVQRVSRGWGHSPPVRQFSSQRANVRILPAGDLGSC